MMEMVRKGVVEQNKVNQEAKNKAMEGKIMA